MIKATTKLLCILGHPIKHSKSPLMHNKMLEILGIDSVYTAFDVEPSKVEDAVKGMKALGITGGNVTIPHKETVMPFLDEITEEAKNIGAVNTIFVKEGKYIGDNTDGRGFIISLMQDGGFDPKGKKALILGAGGAAKAIVTKLAMENICCIGIFDIDQSKSQELVNHAKKLNSTVNATNLKKEEIEQTATQADLIINCTPIGMKETDPELLNKKVFNQTQVVFDLIYNPSETKLLQDAKNAGAKIINGLGMLVYQGALSFERWTGEKPDTNIMMKAITE